MHIRTLMSWNSLANILPVVSALALSACASGEDPTSPSATTSQPGSTEYSLQAGPESRALGVSSWKLDHSGGVEALGADGRPLEKFRILANHGGVVSLGNQQSKLLFDATGAVQLDTLTESDRNLTEALHKDLLAASEGVGNASVAAGAQEALEWVAFACCNAGYAGVLYQYWYNGWTPYCAYRQQGGYCSGLWECGTLAANRGCQYWY